ncbi:hypothetical protein [Chryseobacterium lathyri]|jgi:hypothetical protein|uniref:Uncharacterized protein n=1 Tax=Chryseobacterium lathyri TaxID=395933 RepID=A0A511YCP8_9FLAO|nr:hypothetical protein [Chryseobacterium lathyri]GEN72939.1 hypothetical protein CLA01_30110 [Chryseobacterium lathyri]
MIKMNLNFRNTKIDEAIRENSKRSSMILDLVNTTSWITDEKLFFGREFKNRLEVTRIKTPFTTILPTLIIVFKKKDLQNPKLRLSFFGYAWFSILLLIFLFVIIKKIIDPDFQGDLAFTILLVSFFFLLFAIEFYITKKTFNRLKLRIKE